MVTLDNIGDLVILASLLDVSSLLIRIAYLAFCALVLWQRQYSGLEAVLMYALLGGATSFVALYALIIAIITEECAVGPAIISKEKTPRTYWFAVSFVFVLFFLGLVYVLLFFLNP